jgi:hypothetical protein
VGQPLLAVRWKNATIAADSQEWLSYLTRGASPAKMQSMAHSFLIFDFGKDEEAAQQARHRVEGWKQGFRLDKKMQVKFERKEPEGQAEGSSAETPKPAKASAKGKAKPEGKSKAGAKAAAESDPAPSGSSAIRLIVRLDFSDHEKISHQRWIERIPTEELFKSAHPQIVRAGQPDFKTTSDLFDSLD